MNIGFAMQYCIKPKTKIQKLKQCCTKLKQCCKKLKQCCEKLKQCCQKFKQCCKKSKQCRRKLKQCCQKLVKAMLQKVKAMLHKVEAMLQKTKDRKDKTNKKTLPHWFIGTMALDGRIIGLGRKYYRPWTEILSAWTRPGRNSILRKEILSALDGNIIGLGRGRDGNVLALDGINPVQGRWTTEGRRPSPLYI